MVNGDGLVHNLLLDSYKIDYNNLLNIPYIYWKNPVLLKDDLPNNNNTEGDARVVLNENSIYILKIR